MNIQTVDIIIPVYHPNQEFFTVLDKLNNQTRKADRIILMNTVENDGDSLNAALLGPYREEVIEVPKSAFDHGGTRDLAIRKSTADVVVLMTQDAIPENEFLLEELLKPFADDQVGVVYGRQLPREDCNLIEQYTRMFNYPDEDRAKTLRDLPELGIKTYFCSDVCAAYRRDIYLEMGGFVHPVIFNEDMIMASRIIQSGKTVYYAANARVIHSHNYTNRQQFQRNFDLAVSQADHPEVFADIKSESEGIRMVLQTAKYLCVKGKPWLVISLFFKSAAKYAGYRKGLHYKKNTPEKNKRYSLNKDYWR